MICTLEKVGFPTLYSEKCYFYQKNVQIIIVDHNKHNVSSELKENLNNFWGKWFLKNEITQYVKWLKNLQVIAASLGKDQVKM